MARPEDVPLAHWAPTSLSLYTGGEWFVGWSYVLIEDIVDRVVELVAWEWPSVDQNGRLLWPVDWQPLLGTILMPRLRQQLYTANGLRRHPRPGDVFAVPNLGDGWQTPDVEDVIVHEDLTALFRSPVFDISAEARKAAKIAYLGAITAVTSTPLQDDEPSEDVTDDTYTSELTIDPPAAPPEGPPPTGMSQP